MLYSKPELLSMVLDAAKDMDTSLPCSIIHALSQWQPNTKNVVSSDFPNGDNTTWGLFQFTGQQARQHEYKGELTSLIEVELNIQIGLKILRNCLAIANNRVEQALLLYLGRSRAMMVPSIVALLPAYWELISRRPENHEAKVALPATAGRIG